MTDREALYFEVPGEPKGKQRPGFTSRGGKRAYTPSQTVAYEREVGYLAKQTIMERGGWELDGAFEVTITACFSIPKSWPKWRQQAAAEGLIPHTSKPDGDNITKAVCDALNGVVWTDDSRVYHKEIVKLYTDKEPCVEVTVWRKPTLTREVWLRIKKGG
jgi:Holliday junction resolvase RusA-like endonuclease